MKMILIDSNQKWGVFSGNISKWIYEYINSLKWKHWSHIKSGSLINVDFLVKGLSISLYSWNVVALRIPIVLPTKSQATVHVCASTIKIPI